MRGLGKIKSNKKTAKNGDGWFDLGTKVLIVIFGFIILSSVFNYFRVFSFPFFGFLRNNFGAALLYGYFSSFSGFFIWRYPLFLLLCAIALFLLIKKERLGYYIGGFLLLLSSIWAFYRMFNLEFFDVGFLYKYYILLYVFVVFGGIFGALFCYYKIANDGSSDKTTRFFERGFLIFFILCVVMVLTIYISTTGFVRLTSLVAKGDEGATKKFYKEFGLPSGIEKMKESCNKRGTLEDCARDVFYVFNGTRKYENRFGEKLGYGDYCKVLVDDYNKDMCHAVRSVFLGEDDCYEADDFDFCKTVQSLDFEGCEEYGEIRRVTCKSFVETLEPFLKEG